MHIWLSGIVLLPICSIVVYIYEKFRSVLIAGSGHGSRDIRVVKLQVPVSLINGENNIAILSGMVGLPVMRLLKPKPGLVFSCITQKIRTITLFFNPMNKGLWSLHGEEILRTKESTN